MLDGQLRVVVQPLDEVLLQPGRRARGEGRDDDLVDPLVVDRPASPPCTDPGARPGRALRCPRREGSPARLRRRRSASGCSARDGSLCGQMIRKLAGERAARSRIRSRSGSPTTVSFATTSTFASPPRPSGRRRRARPADRRRRHGRGRSPSAAASRTSPRDASRR